MRGAPIDEVPELLLRAVGDRGADALVSGVDVGDPIGWLVVCDALDEAQALAEERQEYARETGNESLYAFTLNHLAWIVTLRGDLAAGEAAFRLGLASPGVGFPERALLRINLAELLIMRGEWDQAAAELDAAGEQGPTFFLATRRAEIAMWTGDFERGLRLSEPRLRGEEESGVTHPAALVWLSPATG